MNKIEAKRTLSKFLLPVINQYGYVEVKAGSSDFLFKKKTINGQDRIIGGFYDYNPIQKIIYSLSKRNKKVHEILLNFQKRHILSLKITDHTGLIGISYGLINKLDDFAYLPDMKTEEDVQICANMMLAFMENTAFPLLDKFEDLREIDNMINGENFWVNDFTTPYTFGGNFYLKRLIISKLTGLGNYEKTFELIKKDFISHLDGEYREAYKIILQEVENLHLFLKEMG